MQTSFMVTRMADQSCFMDVQEYNEMIKNQEPVQEQQDDQLAIQLPVCQEEENQGSWESTESNDQEELPSPYFTAHEDCSPINIKKVKQQPFLSEVSRSRLELLLKKEGFTHISCLKETSTNLQLKAYSTEMSQGVSLSVTKGMREDFVAIKEESEKFKKIFNNQFLLNHFKVIYYDELFLYVIIQEAYEQTLQDELENLKKNRVSSSLTYSRMLSFLFQASFAITEIHCYNLTHNNINPSNIYKTKDGVYKIGGFGTWRFINKQSLQQFNNIINLRYISPEVLERVSNPAITFSNKTDVYSLSAIILDIILELKSSSASNSCQTPKTNLAKHQAAAGLQHSYTAEQIVLINHFKKHLLNANPSKRMYSYEIVSSLLKFLSASFQSYQELLKNINCILSNPLTDVTLNSTFIMKSRLNYSDMKLDIMKKNLDRLQPLLSIAKVTVENGVLCEDYGLFKKALQRYQEAMELYKKINAGESEEIIDILRNIAQVYQKLGDYQKYHEFSIKSLEIAEKLYIGISHTSITTSLHYTSWSYYFLKNGEKALEYAERALEMKKDLQKTSNSRSVNGSFAYTLDTVGAAYQLLGKQDEALKYFLDSLAILKQFSKGNRPDVAASLNNIGVAYEEMKDYENACSYFTQASQMYTKLYGRYHPLLLVSKKGIQRSLKNLNREEDLMHLEKEIEDIEHQIQKYNI